jgi:hypothetical protein
LPAIITDLGAWSLHPEFPFVEGQPSRLVSGSTPSQVARFEAEQTGRWLTKGEGLIRARQTAWTNRLAVRGAVRRRCHGEAVLRRSFDEARGEERERDRHGNMTRALHRSRRAICSTLRVGVISSSLSQRRPRAIAPTRAARRSSFIGRALAILLESRICLGFFDGGFDQGMKIVAASPITS